MNASGSGPGLRINVCEIFRSVEGETAHAGLPCAFMRTAGCNLRCSYCDTAYARVEGAGEWCGVDDVLGRVEGFCTRLVCITGGEPLLQAEAVGELAGRLLAAGHTVLLETNGTLDVSRVPPGVVRIMDVKCPGSGESGKTLMANLGHLRAGDEVKFVVCDRVDFEWAVAFVRRHGLEDGPGLLFSPAAGAVRARDLADWLLGSGVEARLQVQLHRLLWPERERGA